ncbi:MAG TPA: hypothetical protein VH369_10540 [Bryobacteraceae bacterium]|jgi:hypothetical protein
MKRILILLLAATAALSAGTIDFEAEAANAGGFLTGIPDSPVSIGGATFTGGELRRGEIGLIADQSGVYATQGVFGFGETNRLTIVFALPVSGFSVTVLNGDNTATYTISDDLGDSISASLPSAGSGGAKIFSLPGVGIRRVDISSSNVDGWNFAIDDVSSIAAPEPGSQLLLVLGLLLLGLIAKHKFAGPRTMATPDSTYEHTGETFSTIRSGAHANARIDVTRGAAGTYDDDRFGRSQCIPGLTRGDYGSGYVSGSGYRHGHIANLERIAP